MLGRRVWLTKFSGAGWWQSCHCDRVVESLRFFVSFPAVFLFVPFGLNFGCFMFQPVLQLSSALAVLAVFSANPVASQSGQSRTVPVLVGEAKRMALPVRFETIGTVQPIASVILRPRVEGEIVAVNFEDGADVAAGDLLFELDARSIDAQLRQAEAAIAKTKVQIEQAERDVKRNEALAANEFASKVNLENARTQVAALNAQLMADQAMRDDLKIQHGFHKIHAPISGRVGVTGVKVGNIAKSGDGSTPLAVINQISPIHVVFNMPQRYLPDLRAALARQSGEVVATLQGDRQPITGRLAFIDNAVDSMSGTVMVRALFENSASVLWPGALCNVRLTLSVINDAVTVPAEAVRPSQKGSFVYSIEQGVARLKLVKSGLTVDGRTQIVEGLAGNETVVIDGHVQLVDGAKVELKGQPQGAAQ